MSHVVKSIPMRLENRRQPTKKPVSVPTQRFEWQPYKAHPGEVIMIDFDRFWMDGDDPDADSINIDSPPGVTKKEIAAWEQEHGVTLAEPLRSALKLRNGGFVRNTSIAISSLNDIVPADDAFWEWTELDEDETADHSLMFVFGDESESGATLLMNYNASGPHGSPSVYMDHHGESTYHVNDSILDYFETELESSDEPSVDWSETDAGLSIVARTILDLPISYDGLPASMDQILVRDGETLILFTRERSPGRVVLNRTTLPLPIVAELADIRPFRPGANGTFALHIQPEESEGIIHATSETNSDGRYKNAIANGVPVYVLFEATDRESLESLRTQLIGTAGSARAQAKQDRQTALESTLATLTPEQRTAAMFQAAMALRAETLSQVGDLGPVPPELAQAAEAMRLKLAEAAEKVRQNASANPPDPETIRRIKAYLSDPDAR